MDGHSVAQLKRWIISASIILVYVYAHIYGEKERAHIKQIFVKDET